MFLKRGVVDDDVELPEVGDRSLHCFATECRIADVAANENASPLLFVFDDAARFFGVAVGLEIDDGDVGAFAREEDGDGTSDAGVAAADQRDHSFQLAAAAVQRIVEHRPRPDLRFESRLLLMLLRQRIGGIRARAGLHSRLVFLLRRFARLGAHIWVGVSQKMLQRRRKSVSVGSHQAELISYRPSMSWIPMSQCRAQGGHACVSVSYAHVHGPTYTEEGFSIIHEPTQFSEALLCWRPKFYQGHRCAFGQSCKSAGDSVVRVVVDKHERPTGGQFAGS